MCFSYPPQEDAHRPSIRLDGIDTKINSVPDPLSDVYEHSERFIIDQFAVTHSLCDGVLPEANSDDVNSTQVPVSIMSDVTPHLPSKPPGASTDTALDEHSKMIRTFWPETSSTAQNEFPQFTDLYNKIKEVGRPNYLGARIPLKSGLNMKAWYTLLEHYHDYQLCDLLQYGWPLGYLRDLPPTSSPVNHPSATAHMGHVRKFVDQELQHDALVGPFTADPFTPWVRYSPIMTRPKRDANARRIIVDLSFPHGYAVNDGIDNHNHLGTDITYSLPTITDLMTRLQHQGAAAFLWKADLTRAYRQLRADPLDTPLLGIKLENEIYLDLCPPFGCKSSAAICQRVANAVVYILAQQSCYTLAYLDDYGGCDTTLQQATRSYNTFKATCKTLGLQLAEAKCSPPATQMEWLGYQVDSVKMSIAIPTAKLGQVLLECRAWMKRTKANKRMIQVLVGKLVYVSQCIRSARKFTARILATLRAMKDTDWITIGRPFKSDIRWFLHFAELSNGVYLYDQKRHEYEIECDSSLHGGGGNSTSHFYAWQYSQQHKTNFPQIVHLEAINIIVAYKTLAPTFTLRPAKVVIWTDNIASSFVLQSGKTKDETLASCARELWLQASLFNHEVEIKHKNGDLIPLADALSRKWHDCVKARTADSLVSLWHLQPLQPVVDHYKFFDHEL